MTQKLQSDATFPAPANASGLGIILFAHGSRDAAWRTPIEQVAQTIRQRATSTAVSCAYLELCAPALPEAAAALIAGGASKIRIFPLFLGVGKHAREDLPLLVAELKTTHPGVEVELMATAGENPAMISLMADIALA